MSQDLIDNTDINSTTTTKIRQTKTMNKKTGAANGSDASNNGKDSSKDKPKAFTIKYKRPRGSRACTVCRSRKVRCDAEIHIPCTNCITFGCDCILPEAKKRGNQPGEGKKKRQQVQDGKEKTTKKRKKDLIKGEEDSTVNPSDTTSAVKNNHDDHSSHFSIHRATPVSVASSPRLSGPILNISQVSVPPSLHSTYNTRPQILKRRMHNFKNKAALTFLGASSIGVVPQRIGDNHVELTDDVFEETDNSLDSVELEILKLRGAFLLPNKELALDLINAYFEHVHPLMPVINRTLFMKKFNDPDDSPSLMVLHAVLLCGCRVSKNPLLLDSKGTKNLAALTFFRRAKALYEMNYESDPISIIQTLILIGSYWDGPEDVTKNSFYWTRVAVGVAQGFGFQRDVNNNKNLTTSEKRIWRRIWWCLFEKDRNVAIAFGRPVVIDLNDCDVPMLTIDDFNEDDPELDIVSPYEVDETQALYFIHLVKLAEITGIIIKHQYSVKSESMKRRNAFSIIEHCDMLMGIWFTNLPHQLVFSLADNDTQNFYSCLLNAQYYNRLYLVHRSNLIRMARSSSTNPNNYKYPSWGISFQSARMISIISKILLDRDQIQYVPAIYVYITFSALVMLIYHVDSTNPVIASTASDSLFVSRAVLKELVRYWPIAGVLMKLFDKYADDKCKREQVIANGSAIAEYKENKERRNDSPMELQENQHTIAQPTATPAKANNRNLFSPPGSSITSGISPLGRVYDNFSNLNTSAVRSMPQNNQQLPNMPPKHHTEGETPNIEDLITQYKLPKKLAETGGTSDKPTTNETSPSSSIKSFPDISLVTDNLQNNQNFFANFEPTQLFPNFSLPPTRDQTPGPPEDGPIGSNVYSTMHQSLSQGNEPHQPQQQHTQDQQQQQPHLQQPQPQSNHHHMTPHQHHHPDDILNPNTPGFQTNFVDSSYINMNLQSGLPLEDNLGALFNFYN
ncbi:CTF1 [[Candida] subhashii]|uniref:CTF1 n=1 Tax=[Candida] subhashii TaxID=561895 RepID=A0A8J5R5G2_9ASCO|nr:CTF1 [[Candida] subhashii]KAG7665515.1 CTF1 [[Candida] subhashii]